jgi:hypothetical protein
VPPDQGLYEERYRLAGAVAFSLAVSLGLLGIALLGSHGSVALAFSLLAFVTVTMPCLAAAGGRRIAFRADPMGVTLGADPLSWPGRNNSGVFISWCEVEKIVLYGGPKSRQSGATNRMCIGIQRRPGAPPLPSGNGPARSCPVPGLAEGATRQVVAWRLDRERLTALTAAVAPGVPVIDANPGVEAPVVNASAEAGPGAEAPTIEGRDPG